MLTDMPVGCSSRPIRDQLSTELLLYIDSEVWSETADTHRAMQNVVIRQQANSSVPTAIMTTIKLSFVPAVNQLTTHNINNNIFSLAHSLAAIYHSDAGIVTAPDASMSPEHKFTQTTLLHRIGWWESTTFPYCNGAEETTWYYNAQHTHTQIRQRMWPDLQISSDPRGFWSYLEWIWAVTRPPPTAGLAMTERQHVNNINVKSNNSNNNNNNNNNNNSNKAVCFSDTTLWVKKREALYSCPYLCSILTNFIILSPAYSVGNLQ